MEAEPQAATTVPSEMAATVITATAETAGAGSTVEEVTAGAMVEAAVVTVAEVVATSHAQEQASDASLHPVCAWISINLSSGPHPGDREAVSTHPVFTSTSSRRSCGPSIETSRTFPTPAA